jgi:predicted dehydrogenase
MSALRVAVIGAGHMGRYHAGKLAACAGVALAAVADRELARAETLAREHGCAAVTDYRELIGRIDAAVVSTPTASHHEMGTALLGAGIHVLVEKPIARTVKEADELIALAQRQGLVLQVGHVERYNGAFRALAARMDRPLFIEAERLSGFKQRGTDVDVVLDLMIHDIDLALGLARSEVLAVSASGFRVLTAEIDIANARIEFANGCVASLAASRVSQAPVRKLRVFQPGLYVSADLQAGRLRYVTQSGGTLHESDETHDAGDALAQQAREFVAAAGARGRAAVTGQDGRKALELALEVGRLVNERLHKHAAGT